MPGHFGYIHDGNLDVDIEQSKRLRTYFDHHRAQETRHQDLWLQSLVKDVRESTQGIQNEGSITYWIDGEVYGKNQAFSQFRDWDGVYSIVAFDETNNEILLITDPLGTKPLYWYRTDHFIGWTSEIKCLALLDEAPTWDVSAMDFFLQHGYYPDLTTPLSGVELLPSGTVTRIHVPTRKVTQEKYFDLQELKHSLHVSFATAVDGTVDRLRQAVVDRTFSQEKASIALTGGMDSRCLAQLSHSQQPKSFTFGLGGSDDLILAQKVSKVLSLDHQHLQVNEDNWMQGKEDSVWRTEGMFSYFELHASPVMDSLASIGDSVWNGYGGATVLGGIFLGKQNKHQRFKGVPDEFETWMMEQHVRRRVTQGSIDVGKALVQRKPYISRDLLTWIWSVPEVYRRNYRLFGELLRRLCQPEVLDIPWENTMIPFARTGLTQLALQIKWPSLRRKLNWLQPAFDYSTWCQQESFRSLYHQRVETNGQLDDLIRSDLRMTRDVYIMGRLLATAVWIQQFNQTHEGSPYI